MSFKRKSGPFKHGVGELVKFFDKLEGRSVSIGIWDSGASPKENLAFRMVIHEKGYSVPHAYGAGPRVKVPARPVFRQTFDEFGEDAIEFMRKEIYPKILAGKIDVDTALHQLGLWYEGKLKKQFKRGDFAPLSVHYKVRPSGAMVSPGSKPLLDSGDTRNAVTHKLDVV